MIGTLSSLSSLLCFCCCSRIFNFCIFPVINKWNIWCSKCSFIFVQFLTIVWNRTWKLHIMLRPTFCVVHYDECDSIQLAPSPEPWVNERRVSRAYKTEKILYLCAKLRRIRRAPRDRVTRYNGMRKYAHVQSTQSLNNTYIQTAF